LLVVDRPSGVGASQGWHIDVLFDGPGRNVIDWALIEKHYRDLMRVAISIREGRIASTMLMRRLSSNSRRNHVYRAFREVGKVIRTVQLLRFLSDAPLRRRVTAAGTRRDAGAPWMWGRARRIYRPRRRGWSAASTGWWSRTCRGRAPGRQAHPPVRRHLRMVGRARRAERAHRAAADRLAHRGRDRGRVVADGRDTTDLLSGLTRIGIDEIAYRKGHRYQTHPSLSRAFDSVRSDRTSLLRPSR